MSVTITYFVRGTTTDKGIKRTPDHIFYSPEFRAINSKIKKTETDHYLCYAEFEIN